MLIYLFSNKFSNIFLRIFEKLTPIIGDMKLLWPNLMDARMKGYLNFWNAEWAKHGVCSDFSSVLDYFSTALQLMKHLNPGDYLILHCFENFFYSNSYLYKPNVLFLIYFSVLALTPGSRYTAQDVSNIVKGEIGAYPEVVGQLHKRNKTLQIKEIHICYRSLMHSLTVQEDFQVHVRA